MVELTERRLGAEKSAVDVLIGSGHGVLCLISADRAKAWVGDPLVMDISPTASGYRSDLTEPSTLDLRPRISESSTAPWSAL